MSKIVVFEGADRCGKATQSELLKQHIKKLGMAVAIVEVPIRSAVTYKIIYWMLQNGLAKKFPYIFQLFQFANRKFFEWTKLPRLEADNDVIILDRWSLSTVVYGGAEGVSRKFTVGLSKLLKQPDHTFILLGKAFPHDAEDVYEADASLQEKVREGYAIWAMNNNSICTLMDCRQEKKMLSKKIQAVLVKKNIIAA